MINDRGFFGLIDHLKVLHKIIQTHVSLNLIENFLTRALRLAQCDNIKSNKSLVIFNKCQSEPVEGPFNNNISTTAYRRQELNVKGINYEMNS